MPFDSHRRDYVKPCTNNCPGCKCQPRSVDKYAAADENRSELKLLKTSVPQVVSLQVARTAAAVSASFREALSETFDEAVAR